MRDEQNDFSGKFGQELPVGRDEDRIRTFLHSLGAHGRVSYAPYFVTLARPRRGERSSPALVVNWWGRPMRHLAWKQVVGLLTLAGIVRLGAAVYWHQHWHGQFVFGDSQGYSTWPARLRTASPTSLRAASRFSAPGYPFLLGQCCGYLTVPTRCGRRGSKAASSACSRCWRWPAGRGRSSVRGPHGSPV